MEEEKNTTGTDTEIDTQHEPHAHAKPRLIVGIVSLVVLCVAFYYVWPTWGDKIIETCFGDGEVCTVEIPGIAN